jgi:hypothetical protein
LVAVSGDQSTQVPTTSQANASLVWGHEKSEFEDNQGWQWRAWFKECGKCFKIKAAWGHPDIVRQIYTVHRFPLTETVPQLIVGDTVALSHIYAKVRPSCPQYIPVDANNTPQNTYNYPHSPVFIPLIER